ncbi:MAG: aldehyde dehydrogenase family protein, partial [Betaproteobacteria bacterium]
MSTQQHLNYIAGEWVAGATATQDINPSDLSDVVGEYAQADAAQTLTAIEAARAAFPGWAAFNTQARADLLDKVGNEIIARKDELGRLLSREEGKTLPEGMGEVVRAGNIFKFFGGEVLRRAGELLPSVRPGIDVEITREALGVVGIIAPWNFPSAIPAWKIAPALAYGNCVIMKPADLVPGSTWAMADIIHRAGFPAGVFNLCMGRGSIVGEALLSDPRVDAITFTGSVETGRKVAAKALAGMKKFQLEMGGKNPLVVLDDADLKTAVESAVNGAFFSTGQRCTASSRLIVTKGIHDKFVAAMVERLKGLVVGNALTAGVHIGPVVDKSQLNQDLSYIDIARKEGGKLAFGGNVLERETEGFYLEPALFTDTANAMRINREEVFGPVASVIAVNDYDEALSVANDTPFGLCAGIVTGSLKHASHFRRNAQSGMVMVNLPTAGVDYHVPFGGRKGSSYGPRE